jgi:secreted trypsin-like serine protease
MRAVAAGFAAFTVAAGGCTASDVETTAQDVIGGTVTPEGLYPGVGALYLSSLGGINCTGTLIAPDVVLTAGHCLDPFITAGEIPGFTLVHDTVSSQPAFTPGMRTLQHPEFDLFTDPGSGVTRWNDIALLFLAQPITSVPPIRVGSTSDGALLVPDLPLELVGYGRTSNSSDAVGVMYNGIAPLVVAGTHELQISHPGDVQNCQGDSGGPALADFGDGYRVVGVVSRSAATNQCTQGGIDTRVDAYLEWIYAETGVCAVGDARCTPDASVAPQADADDGGGDDDGMGGGGCCSTSRGTAASSWLLALGVALALGRRRARVR